MKKSIFTFIAIAFAVVASAQTIASTSAEERAKASAEQLRSALSLSEQQYNKVYKAYLKMWRKENKRMAQQEADRTATDNAVKGVLTAEQAKRFEQMQKDAFVPRRIPLKRDPEVIPLPRDPRRTNMYIERE
ncbi:MAG: hypothetical protein II976_03385 [Alistipes sp.]|nr:hypothetical protein [Alistipes sp.]